MDGILLVAPLLLRFTWRAAVAPAAAVSVLSGGALLLRRTLATRRELLDAPLELEEEQSVVQHTLLKLPPPLVPLVQPLLLLLLCTCVLIVMSCLDRRRSAPARSEPSTQQPGARSSAPSTPNRILPDEERAEQAPPSPWLTCRSTTSVTHVHAVRVHELEGQEVERVATEAASRASSAAAAMEKEAAAATREAARAAAGAARAAAEKAAKTKEEEMAQLHMEAARMQKELQQEGWMQKQMDEVHRASMEVARQDSLQKLGRYSLKELQQVHREASQVRMETESQEEEEEEAAEPAEVEAACALSPTRLSSKILARASSLFERRFCPRRVSPSS